MDGEDFARCSDKQRECADCFPYGRHVPLLVDYAVQRAHPAFETVPMYLDTYSRLHVCRATATLFPAPAQVKVGEIFPSVVLANKFPATLLEAWSGKPHVQTRSRIPGTFSLVGCLNEFLRSWEKLYD
eukprot:6688890-Pyramimonas_sp.AAC.2